MTQVRALLLSLFFSTTTYSQSLLWKVSGNGLKEPSYLFGTYHIIKNSYLDKNPNVRTVYEQMPRVIVETEMDSSAILQMTMRALMLNSSLEKLIPEADYKLVAAEFKRTTGYELALFNQMKPILTATILNMMYVERESDTLKHFTGQPIDLYFANEGRKRGKAVIPLETMEEQMAFLFDHDPVEKQAQQLVQMVKDKGKMKEASQSITELYMKQDLDAMWKLGEQYKDSYGDLTYLVDERNLTWMKKLPALMASQPTFIAVGALHLPGPNGLLALLKKAGYTITAQ